MGKPEGKIPPGRPRCRWVDNIKTDLWGRGWGGMEWIDLAQDKGQCRALVNTVMKVGFCIMLASSCVAAQPRRAQLYGVTWLVLNKDMASPVHNHLFLTLSTMQMCLRAGWHSWSSLHLSCGGKWLATLSMKGDPSKVQQKNGWAPELLDVVRKELVLPLRGTEPQHISLATWVLGFTWAKNKKKKTGKFFQSNWTWVTYSSSLKKEAIYFPEMSMNLHQTAWNHVPQAQL
jgi:hypothetical protein